MKLPAETGQTSRSASPKSAVVGLTSSWHVARVISAAQSLGNGAAPGPS